MEELEGLATENAPHDEQTTSWKEETKKESSKVNGSFSASWMTTQVYTYAWPSNSILNSHTSTDGETHWWCCSNHDTLQTVYHATLAFTFYPW